MRYPLEPIRRKALSSEVAELILKTLGTTKSEPGDRLPTERELSELLQVSRTAVREGLKELQAMGVISTRHGEGSFVNRLSMDELLAFDDRRLQIVHIDHEELFHITEVRLLIEGETARLAALNARQEQLKAIRGQLHRLIETGGTGPNSFKPDLLFHLEIAVASGNRVYPRLVRLLMSLMLRYQDEIVEFFPEPYSGQTIEVHRRIFDAIRARAPEEAKKAMEAHLQENADWARERLARAKQG